MGYLLGLLTNVDYYYYYVGNKRHVQMFIQCFAYKILSNTTHTCTGIYISTMAGPETGAYNTNFPTLISFRICFIHWSGMCASRTNVCRVVLCVCVLCVICV